MATAQSLATQGGSRPIMADATGAAALAAFARPAPLADVAVGRELIRMVEQRLGRDPARILDATDLAMLRRARPGDQIGSQTLIEMFDRLAQNTFHFDLGLQFAEWVRISDLGYVAHSWEHYAVLEDLFRAAARFIPIENAALTFRLERVGEEARAVYTLDPALRRGAEQFMETVMALGIKVVRELFIPGWIPLDVEFRHAPQASRHRLFECFRCPVIPSGLEYAIRFRASDLRIRRSVHDGVLGALIESFLEQRATAMPTDLCAEVKRTISWLLRSGHATLNETAAMLAMGPRTLQRKLKGNGTDFATLLAAVRAEIAVAYLSRDESQPIGQLAILLGYSEPSAVSRFLRETFGHDGRVLRQRLSTAAGHNRPDLLS